MYCFVDSWQNSLLLNVAACYQRLNEYVKSIETCNKVGFSSLISFKCVKYSLVLCDIGILWSQLIWVSYKSLTRWSRLSLSGCPFVCVPCMWNSAVCVKQVWSDACATYHLHLRFYETLHLNRVISWRVRCLFEACAHPFYKELVRESCIEAYFWKLGETTWTSTFNTKELRVNFRI
jgi:hypothetical protein